MKRNGPTIGCRRIASIRSLTTRRRAVSTVDGEIANDGSGELGGVEVGARKLGIAASIVDRGEERGLRGGIARGDEDDRRADREGELLDVDRAAFAGEHVFVRERDDEREPLRHELAREPQPEREPRWIDDLHDDEVGARRRAQAIEDAARDALVGVLRDGGFDGVERTGQIGDFARAPDGKTTSASPSTSTVIPG